MTVRLRPMSLADLPAVMVLEDELFAPDTWSEAMYRDELSRPDTRHYLVAEDDGDGSPVVIGYAGLIAYDDEAHVATLGVAGERQGEGLGAPIEPADVTTAGLLRAAADQLTDPSSAAPLIPLYLRRPDATPPAAIKAVSQA